MKKLFYSCFSVLLVIILIIAMRHPDNNLIPSRMILFTLIWIVLLYGIRVFLQYIEKRIVKKGWNLRKISKNALLIYAVMFTVAMYIVSILLRNEPVTDYGSVYYTAWKLASGETVEDWSYFSMWTNNLGTLSILTVLMKTGLLLGMRDPYYFVLACNVLQVTAVMISIFYIVGEVEKDSVDLQWFAVLLFSMWTPVWACTNSFYSDQLSFGGSIIGIALLLYSSGIAGKKKYIVCIIAGVLWGLAISAKATAGIPLVALFLTPFLTKAERKRIQRETLCMTLAIILCLGGMAMISNGYPSKQDEQRLKFPTEYWVALGLLKNGTYGENPEFIDACLVSPDQNARKAYCRQVISENRQNFYDINHIVEKVCVIFGSGEIAPTSHLYPRSENVLWQWVFYEGMYFWKYCCLSTGFFYAVLAIMLLGCLQRVFAKKEENAVVFISYLAVFGLFFFMMFWEAQNKQLYNHIPWMTLCTVGGMKIKCSVKASLGKKILSPRSRKSFPV